MGRTKRPDVVTYESSDGTRRSICGACAQARRDARDWPRSPRTGEELCKVFRGAHWADCEDCAEMAEIEAARS